MTAAVVPGDRDFRAYLDGALEAGVVTPGERRERLLAHDLVVGGRLPAGEESTLLEVDELVAEGMLEDLRPGRPDEDARTARLRELTASAVFRIAGSLDAAQALLAGSSVPAGCLAAGWAERLGFRADDDVELDLDLTERIELLARSAAGGEAASAVSDGKVQPDGRPDRGLDDIGNAARFVDEHAAALRYVPAWNRWLRWDRCRWAEDDVLEHLRRGRDTARSLALEAALERDEARRQALLAHARRSASEARLRAMLAIAASDPRLVVRPADLDTDPWALNTPNGLLDLRTGELRPHRPGELVTMLAGAPYKPDAAAPRWEAHLRRCLVDPELIGFLQRFAGLSAIGTTLEHALLILFGPGANGKSVTVNTLAAALGDYASRATLDLLLQTGRSPGQATPEVADLRARRAVFVSEAPEDGRLASERVKWLTSGEPLTARRLYGQPFTFEPSHTPWLSTNYLPRVPDDGFAIWRRLSVVPFTVTIPEAEQDRHLSTKLAVERSGILRWIVEGALAYQRDGLNPPASVTGATANYRAHEDVFGTYLADRTIAEDGASASAADLLKAHNAWAHETGTSALTANALADKLAARGYERRRVKTGSRYYGIRLRDEDTLDA